MSTRVSTRGFTLAVFACLAWSTACRSTGDKLAKVNRSPTATARLSRLEASLATMEADSDSDAPLAHWILPHALREISGLALTSDGRLLAHNDEAGQVWEIDPRRGVLVKRFSLGEAALKKDFEGIAIAHDRIYMLASDGTIYTFVEGADGARVAYTTIDTKLGKECEFEAITFDAATDALLLACKSVHDKALKDALVIYRWKLSGVAGDSATKLVVPLDSVLAAHGWKSLHPSDVCIDPLTGNYVLVASAEQALIAVTPAGAVVFARALPDRHHQAEGVTITSDGILIVSDEAAKPPAAITLYKWSAMIPRALTLAVKPKGTQ